MANLPSVEKRNRQALKRRARNQVVRSQVKGALKDARTAIAAKDPAQVKAALTEAMRMVGKAKSKGILHPRTAARRISRLAKAASRK